jgi:uncharacterized protein
MKPVKLLISIAVLYIVFALLFYIFQSRFFFFPSTTPNNFVYAFPYPHEEIFIETQDHATLHALYFPKENAKGNILYFHGNAGNLSGWGWIAEDFRQHDYNLLIVDYRTFGKSTGRLSEKNLYQDALAWYNYLNKRFPDQVIIIYGRSIGTGVAIDLASHVNTKMLVLESPFTNLPALAWHHVPIFPFRILSRFHFRSDKKAKDIQSPVHIIHGTNDNIVPYRFGEELYKKFPKGIANFYAIEGGGHNDLNRFDEYHEVLSSLLLK